MKRSDSIASGKVVKPSKSLRATSPRLQVLQATAMHRTILENIEKDPTYDWITSKRKQRDCFEKLHVLHGDHGTNVRKFLANDWEVFNGLQGTDSLVETILKELQDPFELQSQSC